jgi:multiple sugar transport system substrate-binding protein
VSSKVNQYRARSVSRRRFLTVAGSTTSLVLLAACGGGSSAPAKPTEATKPAPPSAPAAAPAASPAPGASPSASPAAGQAAPAAKPAALPKLDGVTLSVVQWSSFIPDADPFFKKQIEDDFMKQTGAKVNIEFVNANDIQPKTAAAIQAGSGPDIIGFRENWTHLYQDALVDVSDITEDLKKEVGDLYPGLDSYIKVNGKYLSYPHDQGNNAFHWRKSWFKEVGVEKFPATYEELFAVGKKLKDKGRPFGQALGHSFGDPPTWCYAFLWAYGGQEVDAQGKVVINSPETIKALSVMKQAWKDVFDETGLAWDDTSNNRAFLAEQISGTNNGTSAWFVARKDKSPFFDDIGLDLVPAGPKGQFLYGGGDSYAIMKYSKNPDAAKAFLRWTMQQDVYQPWFEVNSSYVGGVSAKHDAALPWDKFPASVQIVKQFGPKVRSIGFAGPPNQKASLAWSKYIVVDMFAKACSTDTPEAAAAWAENELKQVYT